MMIRPRTALSSFADPDFLSHAGPAVLRLKLLEATHLAQSRLSTDEVRDLARATAVELSRLISERPCVSIIDHLAKSECLAISAAKAEPAQANPDFPEDQKLLLAWSQ